MYIYYRRAIKMNAKTLEISVIKKDTFYIARAKAI